MSVNTRDLILEIINTVKEKVRENFEEEDGYVKIPIHQEAKRMTYYLLRKRALIPSIAEVIRKRITDPYARTTVWQPLVQLTYRLFKYGWDDKLVKAYESIIEKILEVM